MLRLRTKEEYYNFIEETAKNTSSNAQHLIEYVDYPENVDNTIQIDKADKQGLQGLQELYNVDAIAGSGTDLEKVCNVMDWLTRNSFYSGMQIHKLRDDTSQILKYALKNDFKHAINCRFKAIVLTDLLMSIGIIALPLELVSPVIIDNKFITINVHFMVHVYIPEFNKWVLVDPSFNVIFKDNNGNLLDVFEVRKSLVIDNDLILDGYSFNGSNTRCIEEYKTLFLKDTLEFILTWQSNYRKFKPFQRLFGAEFNCMLSPIGDNFFDRCKSTELDDNTRKWLLKREKEITEIGVIQINEIVN